MGSTTRSFLTARYFGNLWPFVGNAVSSDDDSWIWTCCVHKTPPFPNSTGRGKRATLEQAGGQSLRFAGRKRQGFGDSCLFRRADVLIDTCVLFFPGAPTQQRRPSGDGTTKEGYRECVCLKK
jgi:hypothetical protein